VVIAARMAAIFGLIFKGTSSPTELSQLTTLTNSQGDLQKAMTLESGSLRLVGSKDEVVQVQAQQPMQNTPDFIRAMFRLICLPFGLPIELGMKDVSQVTFISGRLGLRDAERNFRAKQCYLRSRCWYRIFEWWIARERKKQQAGVSDFVTQIPAEAYLYNFSAPAFPIADELNQNQSDLLAIDMGIKSPQCVAAERGMDWSELQDDLETAQTTRDEKDLPELHSTLTRNPAPEPVAVPPQPPTQPDQIKAYARAFRDLLSSNGDLE
jgi:capsid protein